MKRPLLLISLLSAPAVLSAAAIDYIGRATVPGTSTDLSGLTDTITWPAGSMPHNQLGGFGSGIAYAGRGNLFVGVNDRGPGDGAASPHYYDRFQLFELNPDVATKSLQFQLMSTPLMTNANGQHFNGNASDFNTAVPAATMRFDPEAVRVGKDGTYYVSDEYGPYIYQFDPTGKRIGQIQLPSKFAVPNPNADANTELGNVMGRQTNRGMEGLAITPDGRYVVGLMQNALIQDEGLSGLDRLGINNRLVKIDTTTGETQEFFYQLDGISSGRGANEIVAVNDHQFLVLERDNRTFNNNPASVIKKLYLIDTNGATDVSGKALPATGTLDPADGVTNLTPVSKNLFLDMMQFPEFAIDVPEKIEGLSFGPLLPDGRLALYVTTDNDFIGTNPSYIYGFAIDLKETGLAYQAQQFATPEPASFVLGGLALVALAAKQTKRLKPRGQRSLPTLKVRDRF